MIFGPALLVASGRAAPGQQVFAGSAVSDTFTVPRGTFALSMLAVGRGGGGLSATSGGVLNNVAISGGSGGGLSYSNAVPVTPGESLSVVIDATSTRVLRGSTVLLRAMAGTQTTESGTGSSITASAPSGGAASGGVGDVRRSGGDGGSTRFSGTGQGSGGGGGAAGYGGTGGKGSDYSNTSNPTAGAGGGGGGGNRDRDNAGGGGGGVGLLGQGSNGEAGSGSSSGGRGGSGGTAGGDGAFRVSGTAGEYGAGSGGIKNDTTNQTITAAPGGDGAVRIIWGPGRSYPSNAGDV